MNTIDIKCEILSLLGDEIKNSFYKNDNFTTVCDLFDDFKNNDSLLKRISEFEKETEELITGGIDIKDALIAYLVSLGCDECEKRYTDYKDIKRKVFAVPASEKRAFAVYYIGGSVRLEVSKVKDNVVINVHEGTVENGTSHAIALTEDEWNKVVELMKRKDLQ